MKKKIIWLVLVLFVLAVCAACGNAQPIDDNAKENTSPTTETAEPNSDETFEIETSFANLQYPQKWQNKIRSEETENGVEFYSKLDGKDEKLVFTLEFGESEGYHLGTMGETDVYIVEAELDFDETWTDEEKQEIYDMQEAVNVILQGLAETDEFVFSK